MHTSPKIIVDFFSYQNFFIPKLRWPARHQRPYGLVQPLANSLLSNAGGLGRYLVQLEYPVATKVESKPAKLLHCVNTNHFRTYLSVNPHKILHHDRPDTLDYIGAECAGVTVALASGRSASARARRRRNHPAMSKEALSTGRTSGARLSASSSGRRTSSRCLAEGFPLSKRHQLFTLSDTERGCDLTSSTCYDP